MAGMEVNAGEAFDVEGRTVTQLVTWLQSQDQNAHVILAGGGSVVFRKLRAKDGGQVQVDVEHESHQKSKARSKKQSDKQADLDV